MPTTLGKEEESYVHYSATTAGFSYFVIAKKSAAAKMALPPPLQKEEAPVTAEEVPTAAPVAEALEQIEKVTRGKAVWLVPLVALVVILGLLYWYWGRRR